MAFEVNFTYHPKLEEGGYDTTEEKTMTKRYGKGFEELPLERLAANIITQLSRRDIWITNVKVYEFVKKEVRFKETKGGGIVLSNKKFTLDGSHSLLEEHAESPIQAQLVHSQPLVVQQQQLAVPQQQLATIPQNKPVLRYVVFDPPQELMEFTRILKFTRGKRYPIYEEKVADIAKGGQNSTAPSGGFMYYMKDDLGRGLWAKSFYFVDAASQLQYDNEFAEGPSIPRSMNNFVDSARYDNIDMSVQDIRR